MVWTHHDHYQLEATRRARALGWGRDLPKGADFLVWLLQTHLDVAEDGLLGPRTVEAAIRLLEPPTGPVVHARQKTLWDHLRRDWF
jgi:hypothetical protein